VNVNSAVVKLSRWKIKQNRKGKRHGRRRICCCKTVWL